MPLAAKDVIARELSDRGIYGSVKEIQESHLYHTKNCLKNDPLLMSLRGRTAETITPEECDKVCAVLAKAEAQPDPVMRPFQLQLDAQDPEKVRTQTKAAIQDYLLPNNVGGPDGVVNFFIIRNTVPAITDKEAIIKIVQLADDLPYPKELRPRT
jgi:hypothetical protein